MKIPTREEMLEKIRQAEAEMPEALEAAKTLERAMQEQTFSGFLRREVHRCGAATRGIMEDSGIPKVQFIDFMEGLGGLTSDQIDRLVSCLGIELTASRRG